MQLILYSPGIWVLHRFACDYLRYIVLHLCRTQIMENLQFCLQDHSISIYNCVHKCPSQTVPVLHLRQEAWHPPLQGQDSRPLQWCRWTYPRHTTVKCQVDFFGWKPWSVMRKWTKCSFSGRDYKRLWQMMTILKPRSSNSEMRLVHFHFMQGVEKIWQKRKFHQVDIKIQFWNLNEFSKQVAADGEKRRCSCNCTGRASLNCPAGGWWSCWWSWWWWLIWWWWS